MLNSYNVRVFSPVFVCTMAPTVFSIALLALSVTLSSGLNCSFESRSTELVVNCSRSLYPEADFSTPDETLYKSRQAEIITADYQFNKLETITKFTFDKLRKLNLANNNIRMIEDGTFSKVALFELDLSFNKLTSISSRQLMGLKVLRSLSLYGNSISQLAPETFKYVISLERLDLGHNFINGKLDPQLFTLLGNLKVLSLRENTLSGIDSATFKKQGALETLDLAGNNIENIEPTTFEEFYNLKYIDLSYNKLTVLNEQEFESLKHLEYLDLSWNSLENFGGMLELAPSIQVIKIGHNSLKEVEISGKQLKELKEIHVEYNKVENLQFLTTFDRLEVVNVSSNNVSAIEGKYYQFLSTLDLANNSFSEIPTLITPDFLPSLSHLYLDMNPIPALKFPSSNNKFLALQLLSLKHMPLLKKVSRNSLDSLRSSAFRRKRSPPAASNSSVEETEEEEITTLVFEDYEDYTTSDTKESVGNQSEISRNNDDGVLSNGDSESDEEIDTETETKNSDSFKTSPTAVGERNEPNEDDERNETDEDDKQDEQGEKANEKTTQMLRAQMLRAEPPREIKEKKFVDDCKVGGLNLAISHNENLAEIEDESLVNIDICKLDISYNALTTVPQKMLRWEELPLLDIQGNPWDCSCNLQWLLDAVVPKLYPYPGKQEFLYELRCVSPAALRGRRFVHFYNWTEPAFCTEHNEKIRLNPSNGEESTGVTLKLGGSTGMFIGVGVAIAMVALLVGVAAWLHRSNQMKKRARNRRV